VLSYARATRSALDNTCETQNGIQGSQEATGRLGASKDLFFIPNTGCAFNDKGALFTKGVGVDVTTTRRWKGAKLKHPTKKEEFFQTATDYIYDKKKR